jgi:hypothetical protein
VSPRSTLRHANISPYPFFRLLVGDRVELNRIDDLQLMCRILLGKNVFAPLSAPKKILDIAASSGAWCVEVANEYPEATVAGMDWNPIHRDDAPKNCRLLLHDLNDGVPYEDRSIDFVHIRYFSDSLWADEDCFGRPLRWISWRSW